MLLLQLVRVVAQECLVAGHLVSDRRQTYLVDRRLDPHGLNREEELLGYVQDLL